MARLTFEPVQVETHPGSESDQVLMRQFPYPYRAALAICSDIDETRDTDEFLEIQRFLNTKDSTRMGEGVGLEIGNSFYFYDDADHFAYYSGDERAQRVIRDLVQAGYIDCVHSFGDAARHRDQILHGLDALAHFDRRLDVWINHYNAPSDFGKKFAYCFEGCHGDEPGSELYHVDRLIEYGVRYAWLGAITRVIGQSPARKRSYWSTVFDPRAPVSSGSSLLREYAKGALAVGGDERYALQRSNQLTRVTRLEDGRKIHEFIRYADHPRGVSYCATSRGLAHAISPRMLDRLIAVQGFAIIYTHLGKNKDCPQVVAPETQTNLRRLEREYRQGRIYVTTTSKLLNYYTALKHLHWSSHRMDDRIQIEIGNIDDPVFGPTVPTLAQLQGLTFQVPSHRPVTVLFRGAEMENIQHNPADEHGRESVTIPFAPLTWPY